MSDGGTMSFAITRPGPVIGANEPLDPAVRRMVVHLTGGAITHLRTGDDLDTAVHEARKKLKRTRGLIRMVRDGAGRKAYRDVNVVLRDAGRRLGPARDAAVLVTTLDTLIADHRELLAADAFAATRRFLMERHDAELRTLDRQALAEIITSLGTTKLRLARYRDWRAPDAFTSIEPGLRRVYRRGRRGFRSSQRSRSTPDLHEWRKRVKYLRYQMEALVELNRPLIHTEAAALDRLGELLGSDHDLAVLATVVASERLAASSERERWLLVALAYAARTRLQHDAYEVGAALYGERPPAFTDRVGGYWESSGRALAG